MVNGRRAEIALTAVSLVIGATKCTSLVMISIRLIILKSLPVDRSSGMSGQRLEKEISHRGGYYSNVNGSFPIT